MPELMAGNDLDRVGAEAEAAIVFAGQGLLDQPSAETSVSLCGFADRGADVQWELVAEVIVGCCEQGGCR